ncbi:uncharacterized protein PAF06_009460 [Gastrophryne carolinensis]
MASTDPSVGHHHSEMPPSYFKFVSSATLWDRGLYHYTQGQQNERLPQLCPRFISHMAASPEEQTLAQKASTKSGNSTVKRKDMDGRLAHCLNRQWNASAYRGGLRQQETPVMLPRCVLKNVPKRLVPSAASSDEEAEAAAISTCSPIRPDHGTVPEPNLSEEKSNSTNILTASKNRSFSRTKEADIGCNQEMLDGSNTERPDQHQSVVSVNEDRNMCTERKNSDASGRSSSCSRVYRSFSASPSLLYSSISSMSSNTVLPSKLEETLKTSSSTVVTESDGTFNLEAKECDNNGLYSRSGYGSADLFQASSSSVRKYSQASDMSSFDKICHDRFLHHWPVLPPISPQRAFSESTSVDDTDRWSPMAEFSDEIQDAFDELELLATHTGSSQWLKNEKNLLGEGCSSDSDVYRHTDSLTLGLCESEGSLVDLRISLLDHMCCGDEPPENTSAWHDCISMDSHRQLQEVTCISAEGPLPPSASEVQIASETSEVYINGGEDYQQKGFTISTSDKENELKNQEHLSHQPEMQTHSSHTTDSSFCSDSCTSESSLIRGTHEENEAMSLAERDEESHPKSLCRGRPVVLDHTIRQELERQRLGEERRAHAVNIYSRLWNTRPTAARTTQSINISRFEDFDFLAKYCIFSQEKLAEYKRAFEAVDTDKDGYLDCLQVLMALKEIVPANTLSDAEELYVYRILEIVDYYVTDGLTDLRLFAVMASLAQKIAALDSFMRSLIDHMDFKALELKMYKAKQLFLCNIDVESKSITVEQLLVELKAGGISREHEEAAQLQLSHIKKLDILDFLTYLPLFVLIHNSVISNPLDDSQKI